MYGLERMKNHLSVVTEVNGKEINEVPIEDPFHTTTVTHEMEWSFWDWLKLIFKRKETVTLRVKVRSDGVSQGRWFQRAIICDKCRRNRIDDIRHPVEHDHGYHHGDERWCEACYYDHPIPAPVANGCESCNPGAS